MSAPYEATADERDAFEMDDRVETLNQSLAAQTNLMRPDGDWVPWPWPDLTALAGRMKPRDVWFICGFSGNGKTLFVSSAIQEWIRQKVKVYVMPLETAADDFRLYLACQNVGIDPGMVNSGGLLDLPTDLRQRWEYAIGTELDRQITDASFRDYVKIKGVDAVNLIRLRLAAKEAQGVGAKVLIVDHIDHIEATGSNDALKESLAVVKASHQLARKHNLIFLFTSQMNNESVKGGRDRLAQYGPPMPHHVYMGGHKRQVATGMIGLHRRIRDRDADESEQEYVAAIKQSRDGDAPPMDALQPNVMAVTAMKLRNNGAKEGQRCYLAVARGVVNHLSERDRSGTSYGALSRV